MEEECNVMPDRLSKAISCRGRLLLPWTISVAIALLGIVWYWQAQGVRGNEFDEAVYTYVGWNWLDGYWPYRDTWDRKGPLVFLVTMVRSLVFGTAPELIVPQTIFLGAAAAAMTASIAYSLWGGYAAPPAFLLGVLLWAQNHPQSGLEATPGSLIALFTAAAVLVALRSVRTSSSRLHLPLVAAAGVCGGLTLCVKPNAVAGLALGALVLWVLPQHRGLHARAQAVLILLVGALLPIIAFLVAFYMAGALDALQDQYLHFNSVHSRSFISGWGVALIERVRPSLANVGLFRPLYVTLAAFAVFAIATFWHERARQARIMPQDALVPVWIVFELVLFVSNGSWPYHSFPLISPIALGLVWIIAALWRVSALPLGRRWVTVARASSLTVLAISVLSTLVAAASLRPSDSAFRLRNDWTAMISEAASLGPPGSKALFLTWDAPFILNLLHVRAVSRYEHIEPLIVRGYTSDARWAEYLSHLRAHPPRAILINKFDSLTPSDVPGLLDYTLLRFARHSYPTGDSSDFPHRRQFIHFIAGKYQFGYCVDEIAMCILRRSE